MRKAVINITVQIGSIEGLALIGAPAFHGGATVETDKIAAYGDNAFTTVPRNVKSFPETTLTFLDEGDGKADACAALVGTVAAVKVNASYGDGKNAISENISNYDAAILEVVPAGEITVDGERKSAFTVKTVRHGPTATTPATTTATTGA